MDWINECWMFSPSKLKKDIPHKDFTLSSLIFSTYTTCVSLPYHIAGHATLQLYSRQSTRQININNICKNSLAKKKKFDWMPWAPRKGVYGKSGNDYFGPWDEAEHWHWCKEGTPQTTSQAYNSLLQNLLLIRQSPDQPSSSIYAWIQKKSDAV